MSCKVGVDFDNTLVSYDEVMYKAAVRFGFVASEARRDKKSIRDQIRQLPDGEMKWRKLQAFVYGEAMDDARLMEGVADFFDLCKKTGIEIYIVSHKTEFAAADEKGINLRQVALDWMTRQGLFKPQGLGLSNNQVFFESTRRAKAERIKHLGCTYFIDDLEETFLEESFPQGVTKILYHPHGGNSTVPGVKIVRTWTQIQDLISVEHKYLEIDS